MSDTIASLLGMSPEAAKKAKPVSSVLGQSADISAETPQKPAKPAEPAKPARTIVRQKPLWVQKEEKYTGVEWVFHEDTRLWGPVDAV